VGVCALWVLFVLQAFRQHAQLISIEPNALSESAAGQITVFIPARNEEEIVEESVRSVLGQGDLINQIIVIDDKSTDKTSEILGRLSAEFTGLDVFTGEEPDPGNCGKPSALAAAYKRASPSTEWLLFLDADVVLQANSIRSLLAWAQDNQRDMVSGFLNMILVSPLEKLIMPAIAALIGRRFPPREVMSPESPIAFANGQLILIRRNAYEKVQGHNAVISEILEDVRLAEKIKQAGFTLGLVDLRRVAETRMYAHWAELNEGWTKNLFLLMGGRAIVSLYWCVLSILIGCSGIVLLLVCPTPWGLLGFGFVTASQMTIRRRLQFPWAWSVLSFLGSFLSAYILLRSTWKHTFGQHISWKGRNYGNTSHN